MHPFIEVPIYCNTPNSSTLKDLGIESTMDQYEIRQGYLNMDKVLAFYPSNEIPDETIVHCDGDTFSVALSMDRFLKIIG